MSDEPLSPLEAASAIRELSGWSEKLQQRMAGLTWMLWGIVTPAIFVSFALAASAGFVDAPWFGLLWLPWAALGLAFSLVLWRSSHVATPAAPVSWRELAVHGALFVLASVGSVVLVLAARLPLSPPTAVVMGIGLLTGMLGVRAAFAADDREVGVFQAIAGVALIVFGLAQATMLSAAGAAEAIRDAGVVNAVATAVVLTAIGAYRLARS